ncbi:MAG TPA: ABC transporter ATP-binding protein [Paraburkholderia sp.]|nr:ABC transporter ATP-binding protein [Paraburkholderia sp.]
MTQEPDTTKRIGIENVSLTYPANKRGTISTRVLDDISLDLKDGEFVVLLGPSGCGKSTILNLVAGFEFPETGKVLSNGRPVTQPAPERGMVFQHANLFPWLSVLDNITFGPRMQGQDRARYLADAQRYLRLTGLERFASHRSWQLSGGMRQRVALARAWLPNPEVLLMDEPFGALDAQTRLMMQELLLGIWEATRTTILFVTHDVDEALFLADRILLMSARPGRIREEIHVPFERPRDLDSLARDAHYGALRQQILHAVREEARRHHDSSLSPG